MAIRQHGEVAFGNVIGSNIFNILGIAGTTAIVSPIAVPAEIIRLDIWVMLGTALLLVAFAVTGWRVSRTEGAVFLAAYGGYLLVQLSPESDTWRRLSSDRGSAPTKRFQRRT